MEIFLWSVLNLLLLLAFFYLCFRAIQLLKQYAHPAAALPFGVCLVLLGSGKAAPPATNAASPNLLAGDQTGQPLGNASTSQAIPLGCNTLHLRAEYANINGTIRPRGLYAAVAGVVLGHHWEPLAGSVQPRGRQLRYQATLRHHWYLLGAPVFSSTDAFTGVMLLAKAE